MAKPQHWVIKSEPSAYSWEQLQKDGKTEWTGIRSFEARNNLKAMKAGDLLFFYHSGEGKEIVGIARVVGEAKPDPTAPEEDWVAVDVAALAPMKKPVSLATLKSTAAFKEFGLVRKGRLSVSPVTPEQFTRILELGETRLP